MAKWKVGDVVRLKSGGPDMTVTGYTIDGSLVVCAWFEGKKKDKGHFPEATIERVDDEDGSTIAGMNIG